MREYNKLRSDPNPVSAGGQDPDPVFLDPDPVNLHQDLQP